MISGKSFCFRMRKRDGEEGRTGARSRAGGGAGGGAEGRERLGSANDSYRGRAEEGGACKDSSGELGREDTGVWGAEVEAQGSLGVQVLGTEEMIVGPHQGPGRTSGAGFGTGASPDAMLREAGRGAELQDAAQGFPS